MKRYIAAFILLLSGSAPWTFAYDLTVHVLEEGTERVVDDIDVHLVDERGMGVMSASADSLSGAYEFHDVPERPLAVFLMHNDRQYTHPLFEPTREVTVRVAPATGLQEFVVQGDKQFVFDEKSVFVPSRNEKSMSAGGVDLIESMAIASLRVSPVDREIQTAAGEKVSVFIDFLPASAQDLANMRTADVLKVETYNFPKDPRFRGARHVVNYIMRRYEYGGYAKAQAMQSFIDSNGAYSASARTAYRRMTYDITAGASYVDRNHEGADSRSVYRFGDATVTRDRLWDGSKSKSDSWFATMRAILNRKDMVISNTVGLSALHVPVSRSRSLARYSTFPQEALTENASDSRNISPSWSGEFQFFFPKGFSLVLSPSASYAGNRMNSTFGAPGFGLVNDVREDAWDYSLFMTLMKALGRQGQHAVQVSAYGVGTGNNMRYYGTSPASVRGRDYTGGLDVQGNLQFGRFWANVGLAFFLNHTRVDSESVTQFTPSGFLAAGYGLSRHSSLSLSYQQNNNTVPMSERGSNVMMVDELDAVTGNPGLKAYKLHRLTLDYTWMPARTFSLQVSGAFNTARNPIVPVYFPVDLDGRPMMMRTYVAQGKFNSWRYGAAASLRLFDGILSMRCGLYHRIVRRKGPYEGHLGALDLDGSIQAAYRGFFLRAAYVMPRRQMSFSGTVRHPHVLEFTAGWGNGDWNASASLRNPLRSGWTAYTSSLDSGFYSEYSRILGNSRHISVAVNIAYTISYGKEVRRGDEPGQQQGVQSGILK